MKIGLVLLLGILSCPVQAKVIFSCTTTEGKLLEITRHGTEYQYLFGSRSKPELVFRNSRRQVLAQSEKWAGIGRISWAGMTLKNYSYYYFVHYAFDLKNGTDSSTDPGGGVIVSKDKEIGLFYLKESNSLASIRCSKRHPIIENWETEFMG